MNAKGKHTSSIKTFTIAQAESGRSNYFTAVYIILFLTFFILPYFAKADLDDNQRSVVSYGAVADGSVDDSDAINNAIDDAVTYGSHIVFPAGTYLVSETITFDIPAVLEQGAILKPSIGATINTAGRVLIMVDDRSTHFDLSFGGKIVGLRMARPEWFGGKPDSGDTRQAFEDAEASLLINGEIRLDKGNYVFSGSEGPIVSTKALKITGINPRGTMIIITGFKSNFWQFLSTSIDHELSFKISNLSFKCSSNTTSGYIIDVENTSGINQATDGLIDNVIMRSNGNVYGGIRVGALIQTVTIQNILGNRMKNFMVFENAYNCTVTNFRGDGHGEQGSVGITMVGTLAGGGIEAVDFADGMLTNFGIALKVTGTESLRFQNVAACRFDRIYFDDSKYTHNLHLSKMTNSWFSDCYIVSAERYGAFLEDCHTLHFDNCQFDANAYRGVNIENDCTGIFFSGGSAADNGWAMQGNGDGIWIEGGTKKFQIIGMDCRGSRPLDEGGYDKAQGTGINIGANCDEFIVSNNMVTGNLYNDIVNNSGTGSMKIISNNLAPP
jgi:hypothetical protein